MRIANRSSRIEGLSRSPKIKNLLVFSVISFLSLTAIPAGFLFEAEALGPYEIELNLPKIGAKQMALSIQVSHFV